jgi:GTP-binding protein HflX
LLRASGRSYLVTDTVGFIRKLPHQLVDAFGATLEETRLADLILHVADASVPEEELATMTAAVQEVLSEIGASDVPQLSVLSKADLIDDDRRSELARRHPAAVLLSARSGEGIDELVTRIEQEFDRKLTDVELLIPYRDAGRLAELHEISGDLEREETGEGIRIRARLPAPVAARYERFSRDGHGTGR